MHTSMWREWWAYNTVALPNRTRDEIRDVHMAFQGMQNVIPGYGSIPLFGPFINSLPYDVRQQWRDYEKSYVVNGARTTHCLRQLSYAYTENDYQYPIPGADFTSDAGLAEFRGRLLEDLSAGLIPIVEMAGDGQHYDPNGGTYGWPWFMANYERIVRGIGADVLDQCVEFDCWEAVNNGGWSPDNLFEASRLVRSVRPNAVLAWQFSYAWPGDQAGSDKGPIGEWSTDGQDCDVMLAEGDAPFMWQDGQGHWHPYDADGNPANNDDERRAHRDAVNGWQQRARCFLGPACNNALIYPGNMEPWYWVTNPETPRGPRTAVVHELDEFRWTRERVSLDEINAERAYCGALGFTNVC